MADSDVCAAQTSIRRSAANLNPATKPTQSSKIYYFTGQVSSLD